MKNKINRQSEDRVSMGMSVFIALCVVGIFCAVSIAIMENLGNPEQDHKEKHINLPNSNEFFVL
jgi:hypothetical protein